MCDALNDLVALLGLEKVEENLFRGQSQDLGLPQLFGGQVLGQALSAATQTVHAARQVHSLHGYFLRPGDAHRPVIYQVDTVYDDDSFTTRRVTAIQKGRPIFFCSASFHGNEQSTKYQSTMPNVTLPENLDEGSVARLERFPELPIEFLHLDNKTVPDQPARKQLWFRFKGELPDDQSINRNLLSYSSDFNLLTTALIPHNLEHPSPNLQIASLDHAIWFHHDVKINDWLLYDIESPWAGGARGFARGSLYDCQGRLIASTSQEGLTRLRGTPKGSLPT